MGMKKMRIRITQEGRTEIKVEGGSGEDCLLFTNALEQALGKVQQRELTEDYNAKDNILVAEQEQVNSGYTL
ncbi:hypothetical protein TI04_08695 [Achromatium sp. WMS2]|nr:hypothetical protein TI04_08695 [Achromatium sp. WMS2]